MIKNEKIKFGKRALLLLLAVIMLLSYMPFTGVTAFAETSGDWEYTVLEDGTAEITGYNGPKPDMDVDTPVDILSFVLVIPSDLDGHTVTSIGSNAFYNDLSLVNVEIPNSVTSIGDSAFLACFNLFTVIIPSSLEAIGDDAFDECESLFHVFYGGNENDYQNISTADGNEYFTDAITHYNCTSNLIEIRVTDPTCTEAGYTEAYCTLCSESVKGFEVDPLYHDYENEYLAPTCTEWGYDRDVCSRCGDVSYELIEEPLGHDYLLDYFVEPTCTEWGYAQATCQECGDIIVIGEPDFPEELAPLGHDYVGGVCTRCGASEANEPIVPEIIIESTDSGYVLGSEGGATIHCSAPLDEFISVYVNGELVDEANYTLSEGSTILTFKSAYLDTLEAGDYEVTLNFISGSVSTNLTIEKASSDETTTVPSTDEPTTEKTTDKAETEETTATDTEDKNNSATSPSTGAVGKGLLAFAATALVGGAVAIVKKKEQD